MHESITAPCARSRRRSRAAARRMPLLDLARPRVRVGERRARVEAERDERDDARRPCCRKPQLARLRRAVADDPHDRGLDLGRRRPRVACSSSASGSRCVCTEVDLGTASTIARSTSSAISWASSSARSPGSFRWSESSVAAVDRDDADVVDLAHAPDAERRGLARARGAPPRLLRARRARRRRFRAARAATASSTASAAAWPCPTAAPADTPITTSANCGPPPGASAAARRSTGGSMPRDRRARRRLRSTGTRSMSTSTFAPHQPGAATSTSAATKSAAIESPSGYRPRRASRPTSTAREPARSLPKWSAFDARAPRSRTGGPRASETTSARVDRDHDADDGERLPRASTCCRSLPSGA